MRTMILAGGYGTRMGDATSSIPKPMLMIGHKPIIWHIMKTYDYYNFSSFILCLGYKSYLIKDYFLNYHIHTSDLSFQLGSKTVECNAGDPNTYEAYEDWYLTLCDSGIDTPTGGRIKIASPYLDNDIYFMVTYGDGVSDINIKDLVNHHIKYGKLGTVTAVHPPSRFGELALNKTQVVSFKEKPQITEGWINGGYMIFCKKALDYIDPNLSLEEGLISNLVQINELAVYRHKGFWQCVDHQRELDYLNQLWKTDQAKWRL